MEKIWSLEEDKSLPVQTHGEQLKIGDLLLNVAVLSDGQRVIPEEDMQKIFNFLDQVS